MRYLVSLIALCVLLSIGAAAAQGIEKEGAALPLDVSGPHVLKCGRYFAVAMTSASLDKRALLFLPSWKKHPSGWNAFRISHVRTIPDESRGIPHVREVLAGRHEEEIVLLVTINSRDYERAQECLPPPLMTQQASKDEPQHSRLPK